MSRSVPEEEDPQIDPDRSGESVIPDDDEDEEDDEES
jgi:hypothetical protein